MHKGAGAILVTAAVQQNLLQPWGSNAHLSLSYTNVVDLKECLLAIQY